MFEYIFGVDKGVPIDIELNFGEIIRDQNTVAVSHRPFSGYFRQYVKVFGPFS